MLATLYFYDYNNYYNRIVKKEETLEDYAQYQIGSAIPNTNFIPNDDVNTEHVLNWDEELEKPNYMIVSYDNETIGSRWFVIENVRIRNGQYKLTLRRDLMADYYNTVINSDCFVEKAILNDSDPLIYNKEDMTVNQIKIGETVLKDETQTPWLIGYISRENSMEGDVPVTDTVADLTIANRNSWEFGRYIQGSENQLIFFSSFYNQNNFKYFKFKANTWEQLRADYIRQRGATFNRLDNTGNPSVQFESSLNNNYPFYFQPYGQYIHRPLSDASKAQFNSFVNFFLDQSVRNLLKVEALSTDDIAAGYRLFYDSSDEKTSRFYNLNGKVIFITEENKFYRVSLEKTTFDLGYLEENNDSRLKINFNYNGNYYNILNATMRWPDFTNTTPDDDNALEIKYTSDNGYVIRLTDITGTEGFTTVHFDLTTRLHLKDAPYDMFCMPYSSNFKVKDIDGSFIQTNSELNFNVVNTIAEKFSDTAGGLYDLQLLPYCPYESLAYIDTDGKGCIDLSSFDGKPGFSYLKGSDNVNHGVIFYPNISSWSFNIPFSIQISDKKLENQTKVYRLCSPNYNGVFEFNAAMNNGVDFIQIDCTYLPYSPYIHAAPNFKNLYGELFYSDGKADSRGLICKGDFSLATTSDAWSAYQNSNKNYENIFNRQIENMEVQHDVARTREIIGAATGVVSGAAGGAATGMAAGPVGAAAGAVIGGLTSAIGGAIDYSLNERLRNEAIDYSKDQFGYQLGNIKARADSLSKTTAYTYNNRYFIFVEEYDCTDIEKQAFLNKIKFNGMTVMKIGKISDYLQNYYHDEPLRYFKGSLIRLTDIGNDFHILNAIAGEVYKGVFI